MVVLINLAAATERRARMLAQLDRAGIAPRCLGVDLRGADAATVREVARAHFPWLHFDTRRLSAAEVGCWLSHLLAWQAIAATGAAAGTVLEDDLRLAPGFASTRAVLEASSPFDVTFLGTSSRNLSQRRFTIVRGLTLHAPVGAVFNTWGYVIATRFAADFLLEPPASIRWPIDHFLGGRVRAGRPRIAVLQPAVVEEDETLGVQSQIAPHTARLDRARWFEAARRRLLASAMGDAYYRTLYRLL